MCHQVCSFLKQLYRDWTQGPLFWLQMICLVPVCICSCVWMEIVMPNPTNGKLPPHLISVVMVCDILISFILAIAITRYLLNRKKT